LTRSLPFRGDAALWVLAVLGLGIAIALPQPLHLLLGGIGLAVVIVAFIQPLALLPLVVFAVPFGSVLREPPTPGEAAATTTTELAIGATEILVGLLAVAWLARGVRRSDIRMAAAAPVFALLGLIALALLSVGYADDRAAAFKESVKWIELLLAALIVVDLVRDRASALWVIGPLFAAGAVEAAYGAFQYATGSGPEFFAVQGALRAFGHFEQPNPFAGYLTTILPLALAMTLSPGVPKSFRWFSVVCGAILVGGIGLSQSRGAWLGAAVAILVLALTWSHATRRLLLPAGFVAGLAMAMAFAGLLPPSILDRVGQAAEYFGIFDVRTVALTPQNFAVVERMAHWQAGWYMFLDQPWFGVGAGNYGDAYDRYFISGWPEALGHAHNFYLNMLAELGVIGGAVFLLAGVVTFRTLAGPLIASAAQAQSIWRAILAGVVGGLVVFCVHNLFDSLFVHGVQIQIGVLLGLGLTSVKHLGAEGG
jgi:O-antigen ligase